MGMGCLLLRTRGLLGFTLRRLCRALGCSGLCGECLGFLLTCTLLLGLCRSLRCGRRLGLLRRQFLAMPVNRLPPAGNGVLRTRDRQVTCPGFQFFPVRLRISSVGVNSSSKCRLLWRSSAAQHLDGFLHLAGFALLREQRIALLPQNPVDVLVLATRVSFGAAGATPVLDRLGGHLPHAGG